MQFVFGRRDLPVSMQFVFGRRDLPVLMHRFRDKDVPPTEEGYRDKDVPPTRKARGRIGPTSVVREHPLPNGSGSGDPELQA